MMALKPIKNHGFEPLVCGAKIKSIVAVNSTKMETALAMGHEIYIHRRVCKSSSGVMLAPVFPRP
jgi:hypothetical protein